MEEDEDEEGDVMMMEEAMPMQASANSMASAPQKRAKAKTIQDVAGAATWHPWGP